MPGSGSVLLNPEVVRYLEDHRHDEIVIDATTDFGDGMMQCHIRHDRLPQGYNGQVEMFFTPWPYGEIHFRREADV